MPELRDSFAAELKRALERHRLTVTAAAKELEVSRQALHAYLKGDAMPRAKVFARAVKLWDIEFHFGNQAFNKSDFPSPAAPKPVSVPKQITLWEKLDTIKQEDLQIAVKRVGRELRVSVQISIPA
jgi:transcriptional regulator with XRE-family HTH domain